MTPVELDSSALKSSVAFTGRLACMTRAEASRSSANDLMQSASPPGRDPHNRSVKNARCSLRLRGNTMTRRQFIT
jgi:hypothetical protein